MKSFVAIISVSYERMSPMVGLAALSGNSSSGSLPGTLD